MTRDADANHDLRRHPGWWARLEGNEFDLAALAATLDASIPVRIQRFADRYYLRLGVFEQLHDSHEVETRAGEVLRILNGAARIQYGNNREARVDAAARVQPDGQIQHFIHASAMLHARSRLSATITINGESGPAAREPTITERATEIALSDPRAERALRIFGRDDADYRDLYHVLEIAEAAGAGRLYADGSVTKAEVRRFKHTANSLHALGDRARHGHEPTDPPSEPMPFTEAQALIGRVLRAWLVASP